MAALRRVRYAYDYGGQMSSRLTTVLREAPATIPALATLVLFMVWSTSQAGYPVTHWGPGALVRSRPSRYRCVGSRPGRRRYPAPVKIALGCLASYTVLSYLSILWAGVPGDAWEGPTGRCFICSCLRCSRSGLSGVPARCCCWGVDGRDDRAGDLRGAARDDASSTSLQSLLPKRAWCIPAAMRTPMPQVDDGVLAGAAADAQRTPALGSARAARRGEQCC